MRRNMKAERARAGMSASEVAKRIGVHQNALLRWENDEAEPLSSNLMKLASLYGCSIEYLLDQTSDRTARVVSTSDKEEEGE